MPQVSTEEQYSELQQVLDDASTYITDMQNRKAATKARKELQEELDRNNAEKFRDDAMLTMRESRYGIKLLGLNAGEGIWGGGVQLRKSTRIFQSV